MDLYRFKIALEKASLITKVNSIGVLNEKTIHSILKYYYCSNNMQHEVKISQYVADVCDDKDIYEIQTAGFNKLRGKIVEFTKHYHLYIVYPIILNNYITTINADMSTRKKRLSPKKGMIYNIIPELYKISYLIDNHNLSFIMPFLEVDSYRYNTKPDNSNTVKIDSLPTNLIDEIFINKLDDLMIFLPPSLPRQFTSQDLKENAHISLKIAQMTLLILAKNNLVKKAGVRRRYNLYEINERIEDYYPDYDNDFLEL